MGAPASTANEWPRNVGLLGAVLMAAAVFAEWAQVKTGTGNVSVNGLDRGGVWVVAAAAISVIGILMARPEVAVICATCATGYLALTAYQLPGILLDDIGGASEATLAVGVLASLLGAVVLLIAAARGTALAYERARRR